jgi:carboxyl-terminal processing protease
MDKHCERSTTVPSERRPGRWSRLLRLLLAGAVLVAGAACESGRVKRPEVATTTPAGPMVERYLTDALNLIQQHAFYTGRVDWPAVRAEAGRRTADATTTSGTYDTIRRVLSKLGDHHSLLLTPAQANDLKASGAAGRSFGMLALFPERVVIDVAPGGGAERAGVRVGDIVLAVDGRPPQGKEVLDLPMPDTGGGSARVRLDLRRSHGTVHRTVEAADLPAVRPPTAKRLSAAVNLLELFAVVGTTGDPESSRYVRSAYDAIRGVSTATTCGWVVDLRRNTGGSLPPMLQAVGPILGDGKAVGYRDRNGPTQWFAIENGTLAGMGPAVAVTGRPPRLHQPRPPVAVLTSRLTGSSGEGVAMAFRVRPDSRSLGEPTAGVPTGNAPYPLSDRAELHLTEGIGVDRTGATYQARIQPDRPVATDWTRYGSPADPVLQAASRWLEGRCGRR